MIEFDADDLKLEEFNFQDDPEIQILDQNASKFDFEDNLNQMKNENDIFLIKE